MPRLGMLGRAEAERIEAGDRPRAHREDVPQDAADARGRTLVLLDVARMVVALHLEHHGLAVADVDDAGILARALDHPGCLGGQAAQMDARGFVGAVLVPHRREDAELCEGRLPPDQLQDALVLVGLEPVGGNQFGGDLGFVLHGFEAFGGGLAVLRNNGGPGKALYGAFARCPTFCRRGRREQELQHAGGSDLRAEHP